MIIRPEYAFGGVLIFRGDCRNILPYLAAQDIRAQLIMTDPPYFEGTHTGARSQAKRTDGQDPRNAAFIDFRPFTAYDLITSFDAIGTVADNWIISTVDYKAIPYLDGSAGPSPGGLRFVRHGAWIKRNPVPQLTLDRPGQGFESVAIFQSDFSPDPDSWGDWDSVAIMHAQGRKLAWNGKGRPALFWHAVVNKALRKTQKPISLFLEWIDLFSQPGQLIIDPFMGAGTSLIAALERGRLAIGIDESPIACGIAIDRIERWRVEHGF